MKKIKILILIVFILLGSLTWYLFLKPNDYIVRFKVKTSPGTLFSEVEVWNILNQKRDSFLYKINRKTPYTLINETLQIDEMFLVMDWNFKSISDSITEVRIGVKEDKNSIYNRLTVPFFNTLFKKTAIEAVQDFKDDIYYKLETKYKVKYIGIDTIPEIKYAFIASKNINLRDKAHEMIKNNATLLAFINAHKLKDGEHPFLVIDKWNLNDNTIDFRFCFPIKKKDSMPIHEYIKFDVIRPQKALKAIYHGNYITSDRGWFTLLEYAKRHNIPIENNPLEIFYNNPHYGGNELDWKAEVYLPIKNKTE